MLAPEVGACGLQGVKDIAGALVVELIGGDEGEDLGKGELDAGVVFDGGQLEEVLTGVDSMVAGCWVAGGVVVVTEGLAAQGRRAAAAAGGVDVTAAIALDGGFGEFGGAGCVGHEMPPPGLPVDEK
jgi:hypothetical protein